IVWIPSSVQARKIRIAISPRFAAITLLNGTGMGPPGTIGRPKGREGCRGVGSMSFAAGRLRPRPRASDARIGSGLRLGSVQRDEAGIGARPAAPSRGPAARALGAPAGEEPGHLRVRPGDVLLQPAGQPVAHLEREERARAAAVALIAEIEQVADEPV